MGEVVVGGCIRNINHERTEFLIFGKVRKAISRTATWDFQRSNFELFRNLVDRSSGPLEGGSERPRSPGRLDILQK